MKRNKKPSTFIQYEKLLKNFVSFHKIAALVLNVIYLKLIKIELMEKNKIAFFHAFKNF